MKNTIFILSIILFSTSLFAQSQNYSIGIVATHFHNDSDKSRISEAKNPNGYGFLVARKFSEEISMGLTFEYFKDDLESNLGSETNYRFHYSIFLHPFETKFVRPYFSGGVVYTNRKFEYIDSLNKSDKRKDMINGRLGVGLDIPVFSNLFLNGDLALYNNPLGYVGWGSSIGLRISI